MQVLDGRKEEARAGLGSARGRLGSVVAAAMSVVVAAVALSATAVAVADTVVALALDEHGDTFMLADTGDGMSDVGVLAHHRGHVGRLSGHDSVVERRKVRLPDPGRGRGSQLYAEREGRHGDLEIALLHGPVLCQQGSAERLPVWQGRSMPFAETSEDIKVTARPLEGHFW